MNLTTSVVDGTLVVHVSGEVDMSNTETIESTVQADVPNDAHGMVLDLTGVTYLDSAGIRMLFHLESDLATHQQRLAIVVPLGSPIMRTLQAAGVIGSLVLTSTVEAGVPVAKAGAEQRTTEPNGG